MKDYNLDKSKNKEFVIKTPQGEVKITWPHHQQPGFCPHCHKCIPLNSIAFKNVNGNCTETYSGMDAVKAKKLGISIGQNVENKNQIGVCSYCHKSIPVREVIFKMTGGQEK